MADDGWQSRSHADIVGKLGALKADNAFTLANTWSDVYTKLSDAAVSYGNAKSKLAEPDFWTGKGPEAALDEMTTKERELTSESGTSAKAGKMSTALFQDGEVLSQSSRVAQAYPVPPDDTDADSKKKLLEAVRAEAQRLYTSPLEADRPKFTEDSNTTAGGPMPAGPGGNNGGGGGSGSGGSGSGTQTPPSSSDGLASKDTKPQLAGGEGQQAGAGQGQGGQGSGSGGGTPGGGQGAGSGGAGSGLGSGSGGSGLPIGSTTAAGFSPSSTGTGVGGSGSGVGGPSGLSALRGGAGLPGGAAGGNGPGINPAAMGAAGVRGMGPMGMMGGAGGHGRGGKGEDDDDHATPQILINYDNTDEFMGDMPAASPGVIGDWSEQEKAEKAAREREVRRYKALGWDVKFE
ncbi:Uncharacterised protein [Mycobacteroides abscessus subsp. massiliense]|uniref:hypothetical protein n=1 Tax=Mycobacteroides abscessus TaxID=36809 RepID=UPI00057835B1|nr:hypothetical protein [Mycobacteroides abscessus]RIT96963.1 hypothetical protein D2F00_14275 [Mycobacteroides abscessus]SKY32496.1 Uncharacterised protein [Mycobacteroides abscessus subsp. massiliense]SKY73458.1 Uncharacterised protein [Mycobacteroides abscessus subsp. massiliense]